MSTRPHFLESILSREAGPLEHWSIHVEGRPAPLASRLEGAFDSKTRNKGLLGRESLPVGTALVIAPSNAVHTFSMRFPIDLVFANRDGVVVKARAAVPKSRIAIALRGFAVIEMAVGAIASCGLQVGDRLTLHKTR